MKRFVGLYFLFLALLFTIFYANTSVVSTFINETQTNITLFFLEKFLDKGQLEGIDIWINPYYKIIVTQACNGVIPILFLFASILAYPSTFWHKTFWMIVGYIVFTLVNTGRLLFVAYITKTGDGQADFYWAHDVVGNIVLMMVGLGLFVAFIKTSKKIATAI